MITKKIACAAAVALAMGAGTAFAADVEYGGTWCGHSAAKALIAGPELTILSTETWAIETPGTSKPEVLENAAVHCVGYIRILQGKSTSTSACHFTNAAGDTLTGEAVSEPDKPGRWTFLGGTGKWKGIQGGGTYKIVSRGKPEKGASALCLTHSGTYSVPPQ
jgi:hypothetical protein